MKKIGIITWFRYLNYGTMLQAYALQKYLTKIGFDPHLINFQLDDSKNIKKQKKMSFYNSTSLFLHKLARVIYRNDFIQKKNEMNAFIDNNCNTTNNIDSDSEYIKTCNNFNCLVFGSDQIWNPNWYHPYYFGAFDKIKVKRIAYAPSIGVHAIPDNLVSLYKTNLEKFTAIAMREKNSSEIISKLLNKKVYDVADPTLLLSKEEWDSIKSMEKVPKDEFILCYLLTDNKNHWKAIKKYAKKTKKKLVIIPTQGISYFMSKYAIRNCNINDFIGLFSSASQVITDSFHGTIFSLIFNRQFVVFERHCPSNPNSQNDRIYNLLEISGIKNNLLKYNTSVIHTIEQIDYNSINSSIKTTIDKSKQFLKENLK